MFLVNFKGSNGVVTEIKLSQACNQLQQCGEYYTKKINPVCLTFTLPKCAVINSRQIRLFPTQWDLVGKRQVCLGKLNISSNNYKKRFLKNLTGIWTWLRCTTDSEALVGIQRSDILLSVVGDIVCSAMCSEVCVLSWIFQLHAFYLMSNVLGTLCFFNSDNYIEFTF